MSDTSFKKVMISSTAKDLPEHREQIISACQRMSVFKPEMMENLTAEDADAVEVSLRLVDEADIYIGIFAHRYGYVPEKDNPDKISITEMEYNRATELGVPRLIFFMHDDHELKIIDVDKGSKAKKLEALKDRIGKERVAAFFTSPADLRAHCIQALSQLKEKIAQRPEKEAPKFHYVHPLTEPPEPYIAHPYTLLQAVGLIGRQKELNLLTDWITAKGDLAQVRIFNVIAIGGMGKSALTWHWFHNVVPKEWNEMAGRFWWSFYESDARFENFVIRALAYVSRRSVEAIKELPKPERERQLLIILDKESHLIVLDGIERILMAYSRMDAAHLADDEYDQKTANVVAQVYGLPESAAQSFTGEPRLRQTADPRAGQFLRKLTQVRASRILVSSRLYPLALQNIARQPLPGCSAIFLKGLSDEDSVELWRHFGVSGQRDELLQLFHTIDSHPLLLQALAGEIARYRPAPGDFNQWKKDRAGFNPFDLTLKQAKSHILLHAMHGLSEAEHKALHTIAAFRMPAQYKTLISLLIGDGKPCNNEQELDRLLEDLEDRGLIGWDKRANRYDLHPVVRGVVWSGLDREMKLETYSALQEAFEAAPKVDESDIASLEDLTPAIELFYALIGLRKFEDAYQVYRDRIDVAILFRFGVGRLQIELLENFFPEGVDKPPMLDELSKQGFVYNGIALGYQNNGEPKKSCFFYERGNELAVQENLQIDLAVGLGNLSDALQISGKLKPAFDSAKEGWDIGAENDDLYVKGVSSLRIGVCKSIIGDFESSTRAFNDAINNFEELKYDNWVAYVKGYYAQQMLWEGKPQEALNYAKYEEANIGAYANGIIQAKRLIGVASFVLNDYPNADKYLHAALKQARNINLVEEELLMLIALANLSRQLGQSDKARDLLDDIWDLAERGPFPLFHADACNVLCQIERDAGNIKAAVEAATKAYQLAWCDGPPWAYHYGLENAKKHLQELGAEEPVMPVQKDEI